jgi:hypothetical protein
MTVMKLGMNIGLLNATPTPYIQNNNNNNNNMSDALLALRPRNSMW